MFSARSSRGTRTGLFSREAGSLQSSSGLSFWSVGGAHGWWQQDTLTASADHAPNKHAGCGLTIGCRGCGAGHVFGRRIVLRAGPAPLTLVSLGAAGRCTGAVHSARRQAEELP
jgi:hypothetical protein